MSKPIRNDLLYAQASVDWAVSKMPAFQERLNTWVKDNIDIKIEHVEVNPTHDMIIAVPKEFLPLEFSVEAGVFINSIRTALDLLAVALATRHGVTDLGKVYFPFPSSEALFLSKNGYKGHEFIAALPPAEFEVFEALKPYKGGSQILWSLHQLDIARKHMQLLTTSFLPSALQVVGIDISKTFIPIGGNGYINSVDKTYLGFIAKGIPKPNMNLTIDISIDEPDLLVNNKPVIFVLDKFASTVSEIIGYFN